MRISIVGNCQIGGLAKCIRALRPDITAEALAMDGLAQRFGTKEVLLKHLRESTHVFFHVYTAPQFYGSADDLKREIPHAREVPFIAFSGFHPDMVYVQLKQADSHQSILKSPVGDNHSALALFGWKAGLSVDETCRLFQSSVFQRVDFRSMWASSERSLAEVGQRTGCPLSSYVVRWSRQGCFMHTLNHPKVFVLSDMARWMLNEVGLGYRDVQVENLVIDDLMTSTIWPVYGDLASGFGIQGSERFKKEMETSFLDLKDFVTQSHLIYSKHTREEVVCWLSDYWLSDPTLRQDIVQMAQNT